MLFYEPCLSASNYWGSRRNVRNVRQHHLEQDPSERHSGRCITPGCRREAQHQDFDAYLCVSLYFVSYNAGAAISLKENAQCVNIRKEGEREKKRKAREK